MSDVKWTENQLEAINEKENNILVSAAAGSGKTAVLVERIINKIIKDKVDIDKILLVTFTNAAASEMRERILDAIYKKIDEEPENTLLQRQITLLSKASICTIHSFCLDVIKNNFYEIDISPNFRIAEETELEILKYDILEELFEEKYENNDKEFLKLVNLYTSYRSDENLKLLILKIYKFIQSSPNPIKWLEEKVEMLNFEDKTDFDFSDTVWGKVLVNYIKNQVNSNILSLSRIKLKLEKVAEAEKFYNTICLDIQDLEKIDNLKKWDEIYEYLGNYTFSRWPINKKCISEEKEKAKEIREKAKKDINSIKDNLLLNDSKSAIQDIKTMYNTFVILKKIIIEFEEKFALEKKKRNIIDFNDIEHFALKILENEEIAKKYREKFNEIAVDEYQDSNLVQESILTKISNSKNIFMVGDVKQSIYKFRQARPDLFIDKYENYDFVKDLKDTSIGAKIQLFRNFRSMNGIIDLTNTIFNNIMSKKLGEIDYTEEEYLYICEEYEKVSKERKVKSEINIIDLKENDDVEENEAEEETSEEQIENTVLEARYVAKRINELMKSGYKVYDRKEGFRDLKYRDIVILLRSTQVQAQIYEKELTKSGLNVFTDSNNNFLDSIEIQTMLSLLKIIDNPMQDIPLITVLRSNICNFTDDELVEIRIGSLNKSFYESMLEYEKKDAPSKTIISKINNLIQMLEKYRLESEYLPLHELIWKIYLDTGYYNYVTLMPNGISRQANLKLLFEKAKKYESSSFKGLFNFINFIDKLKLSNGDFGSAKLIGENEDVVRIMSIHKSKGLEFPIVFLCGTSKQFNMQDLNDNILMHQNTGFGPKVIDFERKIEYSTLAREAMKLQMKSETISEEMRILYVALTRAKEKLIITAVSKDLENELKKKEQMLSQYEDKDEKINPYIIETCKKYIDWFELVYLKNKKKLDSILDFNIIDKKALVKQSKTEEKIKEDFIKEIQDKISKDKFETEKISKLLNWEYKYSKLCKIETKSAVTKIKKLSEVGENENKNVEFSKPKFLENTIKLTRTEIGTLMHFIIKNMDFHKTYDENMLKKLIETLYKNELITELEAKSVDIKRLLKFSKSEFWNDVKNAKEVYKEKPFYISIPVNKLYENMPETSDTILVQGIIDLYYIDKDGKLVLVDYKTDYVKEGEEDKLHKKYEKQLELYKYALENSLGKKVDKAILYSI